MAPSAVNPTSGTGMPQLDELATTAAVLHPDKYSSRTDSEGGRGAAGSALRKILLKLNISLETETPNNIKIFEDNRGAEKWTRAQSEPNRTKHIDISYHHIRDFVKLGRISILPVETSLQLADAMTKPLPRQQHEFLLGKYCGGPTAF